MKETDHKSKRKIQHNCKTLMQNVTSNNNSHEIGIAHRRKQQQNPQRSLESAALKL